MKLSTYQLLCSKFAVAFELKCNIKLCVSKTKYISDERFLFRKKFRVPFPRKLQGIKDSLVKKLEL